MATRRAMKQSGNPSKSPTGRGRSQDRSRHLEDARHHEESSPVPHPPHRVLRQPTGLQRHHPHTRPPEEVLDIDHGTHEDRPRPGKLMKKGTQGKKAGP